MSRNTGPRCRVPATRNASSTAGAHPFTDATVRASFVTVATSGGWSSSCRLPAPHRCVGARPPSSTSGEPPWKAWVSPLTEFVTPGPAVTTARPGRRVSLPVASAAKTAVASWRTSTSRIGAGCGRSLPPTAASYIGNTCAPDRVNIVSTPCARATSTAISPPCRSVRPSAAGAGAGGAEAAVRAGLAAVWSVIQATYRLGSRPGRRIAYRDVPVPVPVPVLPVPVPALELDVSVASVGIACTPGSPASAW